MQIKNLIYLFLAFSLIAFEGYSQGLPMTGSSRGAGWLTGKLPANTRFNLELGTGFSSFSSGMSMIGNYFSPRLEYDLNPSFTIIAGGSFSFNQYNNLPQSLVVNSNYSEMQKRALTDYSMFVSGRYMINDNLFMTGSVYREQGQLPLMMMNRSVIDYSSQGMSMGLEYRISENFRFGAEVGVNRTDNPYHFNRMHGRSRNSLFPY